MSYSTRRPRHTLRTTVAVSSAVSLAIIMSFTVAQVWKERAALARYKPLAMICYAAPTPALDGLRPVANQPALLCEGIQK